MLSVAFDAPGLDGYCVAYVRLTLLPLPWIKTEGGAAEVPLLSSTTSFVAVRVQGYTRAWPGCQGAWFMPEFSHQGCWQALPSYPSSNPTSALRRAI